MLALQPSSPSRLHALLVTLACCLLALSLGCGGSSNGSLDIGDPSGPATPDMTTDPSKPKDFAKFWLNKMDARFSGIIQGGKDLRAVSNACHRRRSGIDCL